MAGLIAGIRFVKPLEATKTLYKRYETNEQGIPTPNPLVRRYPNGALDTRSIVSSIIDIIKRIKDYARGCDNFSSDVLMPYEKNLLSIVMPITNTDPHFSNLRLTPDEIMMIREGVNSSLEELKTYSGGLGRGSVPGSKLSVDI